MEKRTTSWIHFGMSLPGLFAIRPADLNLFDSFSSLSNGLVKALS